MLHESAPLSILKKVGGKVLITDLEYPSTKLHLLIWNLKRKVLEGRLDLAIFPLNERRKNSIYFPFVSFKLSSD